MKTTAAFALPLAMLASGILTAQTPGDPLIEPVIPTEQIPEIPPAGTPMPDLPAAPGNPSEIPAPPEPPAPGAAIASDTPAAPFGPLEAQKKEMEETDEGFIIKDAGLNDIFQFLAKSAGRQYFHNSKISGPEFSVTGHLNDGNPLMQMEELAFMYGLSLHTKGNTIYALTQAQLGQLPSSEFHYQLRYLRPTDIEQIKQLIMPMLSPGTGIVNFEPKTNTIIIIDSAHRIEQARKLLHGIDKATGQIVVETKILRINTTAAERVGVNWSSSLGANGIPLAISRDLGSIFGLPTNFTSIPTSVGQPGFEFPANANLVLNPAQATGVLRALAEGGLASQVSNPTLITEDNEQATISIIDRIPIITSTTTAGTGGSATTITEEVRYKIDTSDKSIDTDPDKHREIGISLVVTPTLLPDGTIRMKMRPRSAQITGEIIGQSFNGGLGNRYPRVSEAMVESIARIPDGYSLVTGGFYGEVQQRDKNKIPLLGDLPILNFFFKSKESSKEKTSLVFIVTPKSYDPTNKSANKAASNRLHASTVLDCDSEWVDENNPGPAHEPNLPRAVRGLQPHQAPYYPRTSSAPRFGQGGRGK